MLSAFELLHPIRVTASTRIRGWDLSLWDIHHILMFITMAVYTVNPVSAVFAQFPVRDNIRRNLLMAFHTFLGEGRRNED
jgi:hypothetical protein